MTITAVLNSIRGRIHMITSDMPLRKQIFSIPNILGYFRILLLPLIVWRYVTADSIAEFHMAAVIIGISGITDFLDGFIARKFNMITNLGKIVDPVAEKRTSVPHKIIQSRTSKILLLSYLFC